jgi:site-specific recombinase XerD
VPAVRRRRPQRATVTELEPLAHDDLVPVAPQRRDKNPYWVYLHSLDSQLSYNTMKGCLDHIAKVLGCDPAVQHPGEIIPWGSLRYEHTEAIRSRLVKTVDVRRNGAEVPWSPSTINKHLSALRRVLRAAWRLGQMTAEDYHRAIDIENVKGGKRRQAGRDIHPKEITALLAACLDDGRLKGTRDAAMIAVMQSAGLRRAEVADLNRDDYDPGDRRLNIIGKGNKAREVYLHEVAAVYLGRWLAATKQITGPMFVPIDRWGKLRHEAMTPRAIALILDERADEAKVPHIGPHDFRRTFAGNLLDNGIDLARVQQLMGHASPVTTADYDRRPGRERKAAIDTLTLPRPEDLTRTETADA